MSLFYVLVVRHLSGRRFMSVIRYLYVRGTGRAVPTVSRGSTHPYRLLRHCWIGDSILSKISERIYKKNKLSVLLIQSPLFSLSLDPISSFASPLEVGRLLCSLHFRCSLFLVLFVLFRSLLWSRSLWSWALLCPQSFFVSFLAVRFVSFLALVLILVNHEPCRVHVCG